MDFFTKLQQATAQDSHCTHTRKWNNKTCFPGKTRATISSRMQGSLLKCRGVREWGGAHFVWLAGETRAPMHTRNANSWKGSLLHLKSRADLQGEAVEGSQCLRCTARCGAAGWEGIQDRQPVEWEQWEPPWGTRQVLGIPVEAQPPVSFSGPLILYPCHSPVLAQKIWTVPNGAEKI